MKQEVQYYQHTQPFPLESGAWINGLMLAYTTLGQLNENRDNAVWIFHALTASSEAAEWWPGLVGPGKLLDPEKYFIVCVNMPGSCYGSTQALDTDPATGQPWYHRFPFFTTRDMIRSYQPLRHELGIKEIYLGIGGSMGGQQLLEWAVEEPELFKHIVPIATNARHSAWGIAFNATQRMCIEADGTWQNDDPLAGEAGMKAARACALLSYRNYDTYAATQNRNLASPAGEADNSPSSYQRYQGQKLALRFNAFSYYALSLGMDAHDLGRERGGIETALAQIKARTLSVAVDSDILYPPVEQELLAHHIPGAAFSVIHSLYGHDGFLLEYEALEKIIGSFLNQPAPENENHYQAPASGENAISNKKNYHAH